MTQWTALSKTDHAQSLYWPRDGYQFAKNEQAVPVFLAEIGKFLPHFMLGFVKDNDHYQPVAITGLGQGNLYLHPEGSWLGSYIPAALRSYPFQLVDNQEGKQLVCIADGHLTEDPEAKPLFEIDGSLAKPVAETVGFLQECEKNRQITTASTQKLADAGVIEDWPLILERGEGQEPLTVNGLHRISEQALNDLDAETLHALRGGPLSLAYAQMFSSHQLGELTKRAEFLATYHAQQTVEKPANNFDAMFSDDEKLIFDFDK
ncbi:SapC family protein [Roseovarius sp. D0-M9]|uniref:SapC family protein n=1 Tax=Roseovarius sp. D0-M9 TaxID=3127117 RepID=UPI0030105D8F